jgi:hypothetical protein
MLEEFDALQANKTCEIVPCPPHANVTMMAHLIAKKLIALFMIFTNIKALTMIRRSHRLLNPPVSMSYFMLSRLATSPFISLTSKMLFYMVSFRNLSMTSDLVVLLMTRTQIMSVNC